MSKNTITRRQLLGGAAMGIAAGTAGAVGAASGAFAAEVATDSTIWDAEYDVVVLGFGGAGANSAIAAWEQGANVLLCEKAPAGQEPCNTKASGQLIMATDDAEALFTYLTSLSGKYDNWEAEVMHAYCEECTKNFRWMIDVLGVDPDIAFPVDNPALNPDSWEFQNPEWTQFDSLWGMDRKGWIDVWDEFPEKPEAKHCMTLRCGYEAFNGEYYLTLKNAVAAREGERLTVWRGTPGKRLVTDSEGAVVGAIVEHEGAELRVRAKGGVILCTGGYEANADMISNFTQRPYTYLQAGTMNTGDGIRMAQAVGADLWHMSNVSGYMWAYQTPGLSTCTSLGLSFTAVGIFAGITGKRFQDETASNRHGRINIGGEWIMTPMPLPTYYIVDSTAMAEPIIPGFSADNSAELADGQIIAGNTIEELSAAIRAIGEAPDFNLNGELDDALAKYNRHCHANDGAGEEDDWCRMCTQPVEVPPFYAVKIGPTMYNTQGGPRRNKYGQICGIDGMPIQGLFSAGEMGSIFPDMYNGSGNLGETMVFGRLSGTNAALRAQGMFVGATEAYPTFNELKTKAAANAAQKTLTAEGLVDGVYEGVGRGYGGNITLAITVKGGKIVACEGDGPDETPFYGGAALPVYCQEIVDVQDVALVDIASGASNTLRGFKQAVTNALAGAQA